MKTVYADIILITNFCLDYIVLLLSTRFLNFNIHNGRIILASVCGAVFALVTAVAVNASVLRFLSAVMFLPVMCRIAVGRADVKTIVRMNTATYVFSFLLCGISSAFQTMLGGNMKFPFSICMVGAFLLMYFSKRLSRWLHCCIDSENRTVIITTGKKKRKYCLLCDSGNRLVDPYVNLPVILLRKSEKIRLLELTTPIRLIPVTTALGCGLAEGFTPDAVVIKCGKTEREVSAAVCFVNDDNITSECGDGILPYALV